MRRTLHLPMPTLRTTPRQISTTRGKGRAYWPNQCITARLGTTTWSLRLTMVIQTQMLTSKPRIRRKQYRVELYTPRLRWGSARKQACFWALNMKEGLTICAWAATPSTRRMTQSVLYSFSWFGLISESNSRAGILRTAATTSSTKCVYKRWRARAGAGSSRSGIRTSSSFMMHCHQHLGYK